MIFIINGIKRSGKDTFIEMFTKRVSDKYEVYNYSSIKPINDIITDYFLQYDDENNYNNKTEKYRELVSTIKQLSINYCDLPFKSTIDYINKIYNPNTIIFLHIREKTEIDKIVNYCNVSNLKCETILISSDRCIDSSRHSDSLKEINSIHYNHIILNNSDIHDFEIAIELFADENFKL